MRPLRGRILAVAALALTGVTATGCVGYHERYDRDVVYRSAPYHYSYRQPYYYGPIVVYPEPRHTYRHGYAHKPGNGPPPFKRHGNDGHRYYYYYDHDDD